MLCIKKSYFLSIFALFAVLFGSFIFTSGNVSAVSSSYSLTNSNIYQFRLCDDTSSTLVHCSDISYMYLSNFDFNVPYGKFTIQCQRSGSSSWLFNYEVYSVTSLYDISSYISYYSCIKLQTTSTYQFPSSWSFDLTLSDSNPSASCPACPTCPELPDNPYDPKFDEIKQAILIIPATVLVIYFFFCIYRMLLKGRE